MTNSNFALIIHDGEIDDLVKVLKQDLNVQKIKSTNSLEQAASAIQRYEGLDLVMVDLELAGENAFDFVKNARLNVLSKKTKFVLMGNKVEKDFLIKAANYGYSAFINKPFEKEQVYTRLKKLLPYVDTRATNQLNLLEKVEATLRFKDKEISGEIQDISDTGCYICTPRIGRLGIEIYDLVTIRVKINDESFGVNAQIVHMEKNDSMGFDGIIHGLEFTKPDENTALEFAKLWAYILRD